MAGHGQALLVRGEPGIGKTVLLRAAVAGLPQERLLWATGAPSELELPYGTLIQLLLARRHLFDRLPDPLRGPLESALGLQTTPDGPAELSVSLGCLFVLSSAAGEGLVCVVDDVQWVDQPSGKVLRFVARRLEAENICLLLAERDGDPGLGETRDLPTLRLGPLDAGAAGVMLRTVAPTSPMRWWPPWSSRWEAIRLRCTSWVASGVCAHLATTDYIASTHRGHGHCIAKWCAFRDMLAELYGARPACARAGEGRCISPTSNAECWAPTPSSAEGSPSPPVER